MFFREPRVELSSTLSNHHDLSRENQPAFSECRMDSMTSSRNATRSPSTCTRPSEYASPNAISGSRANCASVRRSATTTFAFGLDPFLEALPAASRPSTSWNGGFPAMRRIFPISHFSVEETAIVPPPTSSGHQYPLNLCVKVCNLLIHGTAKCQSLRKWAVKPHGKCPLAYLDWKRSPFEFCLRSCRPLARLGAQPRGCAGDRGCQWKPPRERQ